VRRRWRSEWQSQRSPPGFRLSALDVGVLAVGAIAAVATASIAPSWAIAIGLPVAHFFLFCNVFRISRRLELLWAGVFVILAASTVTWGAPVWMATVLVSVCVTVAGVVVEMCKPSYHGVGWQRINPHLREWWADDLRGFSEQKCVRYIDIDHDTNVDEALMAEWVR